MDLDRFGRDAEFVGNPLGGMTGKHQQRGLLFSIGQSRCAAVSQGFFEPWRATE
jgi:hypothetical protein